MRNSTSIREAYWEAEKHFINAIDIAITQNNEQERAKMQQLSKINENAYFVLFWGQFESFINDKVMEFESSTVKIDFMKRVEYAIPKKRKEYKEIETYYGWRCKLAHGEADMFKHLILASVFDKIDEIIEKIEEHPLSLWGNIYDVSFEDTAGR